MPFAIKPLYLVYGPQLTKLLAIAAEIKANFGAIRRSSFADLQEFLAAIPKYKMQVSNKDLLTNLSKQQDLLTSLDQQNAPRANYDYLLEVTLEDGKLSQAQIAALIDFFEFSRAKGNIVVLMISWNLGKNAWQSAWIKYIKTHGSIITATDPATREETYTVFGLTKLLTITKGCQGRRKILQYLQELRKNSQEPLLVLWAIIEAIKQVGCKLLANRINSKNQGEANIIDNKNINTNINNNIVINNNNAEKLNILLAKAANLDLLIKNNPEDLKSAVKAEYIWMALMEVCVEFIS